MSCKPKKNSLRMADGGEAVNRWAGQQLRMADGGVQGLMGGDRLAQQNAATAASSIVKDASQQAGAAALGATRPAFPAVPYNAQPAAGAKAFAAPPAVPGVSPLAPNPTDQRLAAGTRASPGMLPNAGGGDIQFDSATRTLSNAAGRANAPLASPLTMGSAQNQAARNSLLQRTPGFTDFSKRPQDGLFMADGGEAPPTSLRGLYNRITAPRAPASAPQPAASAPTPALTGISGYVANSALARREAAAGLQDGGQVPGSGEGDKIPAKYEPGEFVVSNDMIDDNPGLRETLHSLRAETLNARGKTVAEADAGAVKRGSLRAMNGADWDTITRGQLAQGQAGIEDMLDQKVPRGQGGVAGRAAAIEAQKALMQQPAGEAARYAKPAPSFAPAAPAPAPAPASPVAPAVPSVKAGVAAEAGVGGKAGYLGGRAVGAAAGAVGGLARTLGPIATGAGVIESMNDYKLNDPNVDSSLVGTGRALGRDLYAAGKEGQVGLPETVASLKKGATEAAMDLGSFAAKTADIGPWIANKLGANVSANPVSTAYEGMLRDQFGDKLAPHSAPPKAAPIAAAAPVAAPAAASAPTPAPIAQPAPVQPALRSGFDGFTAPVQAQEDAPIMVAPSIRHSGNDWQARNDLRSLEVRASSINQKRPRGGMSVAEAAYLGAQKHDQELKGGNTLAEVAGIKAASEANTSRNTLRSYRHTADQALKGHQVPLQVEGMKLQMQRNMMGAMQQLAAAHTNPKTGQVDTVAAANTARQAGLMSVADEFDKSSKSTQDLAAKGQDMERGVYDHVRNGVKGQYNHMNPDGDVKRTEAIETGAANGILQMHPELRGMTQAQINEKLPRFRAEQEAMHVFREPKDYGWGGAMPSFLPGVEQQRDPMTMRPGHDVLRGAEIKDKATALNRLSAPNKTTGDRMLYTPSGRNLSIPAGMSNEGLAVLKDWIDEANASKPSIRAK